MRAIIGLTYAFIFFNLIGTISADVGDFLSQVSNDVGNALHTAWSKITLAIKRPVRIRRLGKVQRRKRTTAMTTTEAPPIDVSTIAIYLFSGATQRPPARPTIPVFTSPTFKSMAEWRKQQIPYIWRPIKWLRGNPITTLMELYDDNMDDHTTPTIFQTEVIGESGRLLYFA